MTDMETSELARLAEPGPEHERLKTLEGDWNLTSRWWMEPGEEPLKVSGTGSNRMILGGRFLEMRTELSGNPYFRDEDGTPDPMETRVIYGFDRRRDEYTLVGFDTLGTFYVTASGTYDADSATITLRGRDEDPALQTVQEYDMHLRFESDDRVVWDVVFQTAEGEGFKVMEVVSTRRE